MKRIVFAALAAGLAACAPPGPEVIVYASIDELYARPLFEAFTKESGIRVRAVFDTEEAKTLGLVHRLLAERKRPQADVFWNGECARTILLKDEGLLEAYRPSSAEGIPARWRDPADTWTGFGARARVIVHRMKDPPRTLKALADPKWKGRVAMAHPAFGTTATHLFALAQVRGEAPVLDWLRALKANDVRIVGGNSHVRDLVARGECDLGLTDSDDVAIGQARGDAIELAHPEGDRVLIPNTAALIRGAPHAAEGRRFLDWLLRSETEQILAAGPSRQFPLRPGRYELIDPEVDWSKLRPSEAFLDKARKALGL